MCVVIFLYSKYKFGSCCSQRLLPPYFLISLLFILVLVGTYKLAGNQFSLSTCVYQIFMMVSFKLLLEDIKHLC